MKEYLELGSNEGQPITVTGRQGIYSLMFPQAADMDFSQAFQRRYFEREVNLRDLFRSLGRVTGDEIALTSDHRQQITLAPDVAAAFGELGGLLMDLSALKQRFILPPNGAELQNFTSVALCAMVTHEPLQMYVPCCPDWSQDSAGQYDYRFLGGGPSFIAEKFFSEVPPVLATFLQHGVPYEGTVVIADWGLENDIAAYDRSGRQLLPNEVRERFLSTAEYAKEHLARLQQSGDTSQLFKDMKVATMTEVFDEQGVDPEATYYEARVLFESHSRGVKLVNELHNASLAINQRRRGLSGEENREQALQGVAEYATFSSALPDNGIIFAAESQTTSKAYNTVRQAKIPVFFLKGESKRSQAVNIL